MSMFDVTRVSAEVGDGQISFETGKLAKQARGAVVVQAGDTMVLCTATVGNLRDVDFLPLTVDVEERMYAAGKIPGSFFRREGRSGEKATLTARMIDRPIRPLFPKGWHYETQLVAIPMSVDQVHPYDILAMNGASAALAISPIPVAAHVGAVRIGKLDGDFVVNPSEEDLPRARPRPDRRRHRRGDPDGRGRRQRRHRGRRSSTRSTSPTPRSRSSARRWRSSSRRPARRSSRSRPPRSTRACSRRSAPRTAGKIDEATSIKEKLDRQDAVDAVKEEVLEVRPGRRGRRGRRGARAEVGAAFVDVEKDIIRKRDRGRQEAPRRPRPGRDPADRVRGRHLPARARLGPVHPRRDADPLQRRAGHDPHGHADRHPRAGDLEEVLAPLQLPALLGRGGRLHARPEAPRHRPRRARRAGAGARRSRTRRSSPTWSGSSPRRWSRTAPRRWARSAPPRWRCRRRGCRSRRRSPASRWA